MNDLVKWLRQCAKEDVGDAPETNVMWKAADRILDLETAMRRALSCTPQLRPTRDGLAVELVYDCGDPWAILREALEVQP